MSIDMQLQVTASLLRRGDLLDRLSNGLTLLGALFGLSLQKEVHPACRDVLCQHRLRLSHQEVDHQVAQRDTILRLRRSLAQRCQPFGLPHLDEASKIVSRLCVQVFLGAEVVRNGPQIHVGGLRQHAGRGAVKAMLAEDIQGRLQHFFARQGAFAVVGWVQICG